MMGQLIWPRAAAIGAGLSTLALAATLVMMHPAPAAARGFNTGSTGGLYYSESGGGTDPGGSYSAVVACSEVANSKFIHLTGGGMATNAEFGEITIVENWPGATLDVDAWQNRVTVEPVVEQDVSLDSFAICTNEQPNVRSKGFSVNAGEVLSTEVDCPAGKPVTSGGWKLPDGSIYETSSSRPFDDADAGKSPDDGWRIRVENRGGAPVNGTAWAVCTNEFNPKYHRGTVPIPGTGQADRVTRCGDKENLLGGGLRGSSATGHEIVGTLAVDRGDANDLPDDGFAGGVDSVSLQDGKLAVYAICK